MKRFNQLLAVLLWVSFVLFISNGAALAQDDTSASTPASQQQPADEDTQNRPATSNQTSQNQKPIDVSTQAQQDAADTPPSSFDRQPVNLSTGQVLSKTRSPLHWGKLSVMSFELMQVYDSNYLFLKDNPLSAQAGAVQGLFVYSLKSSRASLSLQYRPQFWASDQTHQFDYSSHMLDFHTFRYLSPRWAINVSDQFQYSPDRGRLNEVGFSPDYSTGTSTQNPFLSTGRRMVNNQFGVSVDRRFTAHDSIEMSVRQQYIRLSSADNTQLQDPIASATEQQDYAGQIGWTHTWRTDNEIGIQYSYDRQFFNGFDSSAQLHGILFGFSRRLRPSLLLRIGGGPALLLPAKTNGAIQPLESQFTYQANAALYKSFRHSGMTLSYSRNNTFTGQISDGLNDRVDASYSQRLFHRLDAIIGGAYVRQNYSLGPHLYGKSGWSELDWHLSRSWSIYGTYSYLTQAGGPVLFGPRQLVTSGIRWNFDFERGQSFGK
jgi:hypothetical protein